MLTTQPTFTCSKPTMETPEQCAIVDIVDFVQINATWEGLYPANIYLFKVNNRSTGKRCEIYSKLAIKAPERRHFCRSGVFIVNFELVSHLPPVVLLLTLNE